MRITLCQLSLVSEYVVHSELNKTMPWFNAFRKVFLNTQSQQMLMAFYSSYKFKKHPPCISRCKGLTLEKGARGQCL